MRKRLLPLCLMLISLCLAAGASDLPAILAPGGLLCLVNREYHLTSKDAPADLVTPRVSVRKESLKERIPLRQEAAHALEALFEAAMNEAAYRLLAVSGYRSYGMQQVLFNQKAEAVGAATASKTVARAGQSEHQLGLAMDIQCPDTLTLSSDFASTPEGQWVADNAHRFGFIIRYKQEWTQITGYDYEPWHLRYIGIAHATAMHLLDIPFETYYDQLLKLPEYVLMQGNPYLLSGVVDDLIHGNDAVLSLLPDAPEDVEAVLRRASEKYLPRGISYETAYYLGYPTPVPPPPPRVDTDVDEVSYLSTLQ